MSYDVVVSFNTNKQAESNNFNILSRLAGPGRLIELEGAERRSRVAYACESYDEASRLRTLIYVTFRLDAVNVCIIKSTSPQISHNEIEDGPVTSLMQKARKPPNWISLEIVLAIFAVLATLMLLLYRN